MFLSHIEVSFSQFLSSAPSLPLSLKAISMSLKRRLLWRLGLLFLPSCVAGSNEERIVNQEFRQRQATASGVGPRVACCWMALNQSSGSCRKQPIP